MAKKNDKSSSVGPTIENRRAHHDYSISESVECGMELKGTEVKSVRASQVSLAEGWVMAEFAPLRLDLHGVHIAEYPPAGRDRQHEPLRVRKLLAKRREIERLAGMMKAKGVALVPLKIYFKNGFAKLLVGVGLGKTKSDKRQSIAKRESQREIDRAVHRRR
ncbi:MAG: SsrA-binding protein SmpB [Phycisphaerales bacterium]|nr:SsrA-binding protein SmpB [Phycisphaerales bacterium]